MSKAKALRRAHPQGAAKGRREAENPAVATGEACGGKVGLRWDKEAGVTAFGQLPCLVEFLKTSGLFEAWVKDCPLSYTSPNAPAKREVLATLLWSVLARQRRYAQSDALRADTPPPTLLGGGKLVSEDSARRAFKQVAEDASQQWLEGHLKHSCEELLEEDWILDVDATVKPLYGRQEGARPGCNPAKPGRPSHAYHCCMAANIRLLLGVESQSGNQTAPSYAQPRLGKFLDELAARGGSRAGRARGSYGPSARREERGDAPHRPRRTTTSEGRNPLSPFGLRRREVDCFVGVRLRYKRIAVLTPPRIRPRGARHAAHATSATGC